MVAISNSNQRLIQETRTITIAEASGQEITLLETPYSGTNTFIWVVGGTIQANASDYSVSGQVISWTGTPTISSGDVLVIAYTIG